MKAAIGITWFPRKVETFQTMQHSLNHDNVTVYPDGIEFTHRTDYPVKMLGNHKGCFKHYYRVLSDLCDTDADIVGVFSDDVIFKGDWLTEATRMFNRNPYVGYLACYTPRGIAGKWQNKKGWNELKGGWATSWGGAYLMRREVAVKVLNHPYIINHRDNYEKNQQIDHAIPEAMHRMGYQQFAHNPSFMKHIGLFSTLGHKHRKIDEALGWNS